MSPMLIECPNCRGVMLKPVRKRAPTRLRPSDAVASSYTCPRCRTHYSYFKKDYRLVVRSAADVTSDSARDVPAADADSKSRAGKA